MSKSKEYYELIKLYPGSPLLGTKISGAQHEYYTIKPYNFPEFWEKHDLNPNKEIIGLDGERLFIGEKCYFLDKKSLFKEMYLYEEYFNQNNITEDGKLSIPAFSTKENAIKYIESGIDVKIENETIQGENIELFALMIDGCRYQISNTTSLELHKRMVDNKPTSEKWKYFRTEKEMQHYIDLNLKRFSFLDIQKIFPEIKIDEIKQKFHE